MTDTPSSTAPVVDADAEQVFFADPAIDRLAGMVFALMAELHVTKDRLQILEHMLETSGALRREDLDRFEPTPAQAQEFGRERRAFVEHVMDPLRGRLASKSEPSVVPS